MSVTLGGPPAPNPWYSPPCGVGGGGVAFY